MYRTFRSLAALVAASALAWTAFGGSAPEARAEPDPPRPGEIEVFRGGERSVVRGTLHDRSLREESGVLGMRGVAVGAPSRAPEGLATLGGPARERLAADLEAIGLVYTELLELRAGPELAAQLTALEPGEPLRVPHRHEASHTLLAPGVLTPALLTPGQALAERTRHEASHAWVHALAPGAPAWLDEGLACYFETLERGPAGEVRVRANPRRHDALRAAARAGKVPDLAELRRLSRPELAREPAAASWALAFSLMQTPAARDVLRALLRGEAEGELAGQLTALGADEPGALPRRWQRSASGGVAAQLLVQAPAPEVVEGDGEEEPEPLYRRVVRCVRGIQGAGSDARPALICVRRVVRVVPDRD